jgi:hypothetical protein
MLSDLKTLLDILESLLGLRRSDRERVAALLEQIASEAQAIADLWESIVAKLVASST